MDQTKSSVNKLNPKPVSVFYVWYSELCRRLNINPAPVVKPVKPKCQTVLDFVADRLKVDEWNPVLTALRHDTSLHVIAVRSRISNGQFLHDVDTEEKAKNTKRKYGSIWTAYILKQLLKSISHSLRCTQVLTYLEFDGLPLFMQYLEPLLQALKKNRTLKTLSLSNCTVQDAGCQLVCSYLRFTPNIEVLNLSGCNLSPVSGEYLANLVKYQQINRYCESWHSSLRYENPDTGKMRGIKRISINCNPFFGDTGLNFILDELEDDLWVKALDMQKCGVTENIATRLIDVVDYNKTLEIVDLRQNDLLNISTIEKVLQILKQRQQFGMQPEFQWCATAVTLTWSSVYSATSKCSFTTSTGVHKTRSAPMRAISSKVSSVTWDPAVRKTKTLDSIQKGTKFSSLSDTKKQVLELNDKLQKEIQRRREIEKRNEKLQSQLNRIKTQTSCTRKTSLSADRNPVAAKPNGLIKKESPDNNICVTRVELNKRNKTKPIGPQKPLVVRRKQGNFNNNSTKEGVVQPVVNGFVKNGLQNGHTNGFNKNNVYDILEKLLNSGQPIEQKVDHEMLKYFTLPTYEQKPTNNHVVSPGNSLSTSQVSLYKYMEELKTDKT